VRSQIAPNQIPAAIEKCTRLRMHLAGNEAEFARKSLFSTSGIVEQAVSDINATIDDVFGERTTEARRDFRVSGLWFLANGSDLPLYRMQAFKKGFDRALATVDSAIRRLNDKLEDSKLESTDRILQAYRGLDLQKDVAQAASTLYLSGHYRNAVMDAVIALNNLVRLKSGEQRDGTTLMEYVFSPKHPILRFNALTDDSDHDEQKGFMMMLSGAVSGLRNPRAHALFDDDPERALEFIAFVSLLAKLVEGATRA
jgi:uncharacterized protein (TIGR02391 family)